MTATLMSAGVFAVGSSANAGVRDEGTPAVVRAAVDRILSDPGKLIGNRSWRTHLAPKLRALPQWNTTMVLALPVKGTVIAGTVRLPKHLKVAGDTTIVADVVETESTKSRITTNGHDFHLLPITDVRGGITTSNTVAQTIVIDTSSSNAGINGHPGTAGFDGWPGEDGQDGYVDVVTCEGQFGGGAGTDGESGTAGGSGGAGGAGDDAGDITLVVPAGSQDSYELIARGAPGGFGGPGGDGGNGANGGNGGSGASVDYDCGGHGGDGGDGGAGGNGGKGGDGGTGGAGGKGGDVSLSYPASYPRSRITTTLFGGTGGPGGTAGFSGTPGPGGVGGSGGFGVRGSGRDGRDGAGGTQSPGSQGNTGSSGATGTITENAVTALGTDKPAYVVGESPTYTVYGPAGSPIYWSSFKDGISTGEVDAFYGQYTNAGGTFTSTGPAWTFDDVSPDWEKRVKVGGHQASATFQVRESGAWQAWTPLRGALTDQPTAARHMRFWNNLDREQIVVAGRGADGGVRATIGRTRYNDWENWPNLGGNATAKAVAARGRYIFTRDATGAVVYSVRVESSSFIGWDGWRSLGGFIQGAPAVAEVNATLGHPAEDQSYLMVFGRGGDNALYVNRQLGHGSHSWSGWERLGGDLASEPTVVERNATGQTWLTNTVQVFGRNAAGGVITRLFNGTSWEGWQDLGGSVQGTLSASATAYGASWNPPPNNLVNYTFVFGRGTDDALHVNRMENGVWSGWQNLGGVLRSDPVSATNPSNSPAYVAARGTDDAIHLIAWTRHDGWRYWKSLAGSTSVAPAMTGNGVSYVEIFGVNRDSGKVYHRTEGFY